MAHYIALIHKDESSDYGVSFPDLPGLATAGASLDEARAFAEEALALHLEGLAEDGEPIPEPSSLDALMNEAENRRAVAIMVRAETQARTVRVNITVPEDTLREIDRYAEAHGFTRSGFLAQAAKKAMAA
ncbi:type II toxin-antitoxin system HicB family antitoxin [Brevundimonas sp. PAMC22021]|uniref:type II toxin-antitoxin system HicB family antitoxin n=1 Tax=Brevundimonas sp. PAMC22021 TaxID=2861285 RepID=UPI001C6387E1|nr:type II toxin-antitoxin system HicB family antitoxin [Brevundimonas sp. PAMC22021]QYF86069.1 type II toxin-antitoxin system HicB family antitoxin [Brevundimonas sp. PAMC22021]